MALFYFLLIALSGFSSMLVAHSADQEGAHKALYHDVPEHFFTLALDKVYDKVNVLPIAIIGGGSAGLGAAIAAARAKIHTVVFTGPLTGGQLTQTSYVENWPGIKMITGPQLMRDVQDQAEDHGVLLREETIERVEFNTWPFILHTSDGTVVHALTVIIATGAAPRKLGVPHESTYFGTGVSSCAVCDCVFFKNKNVYIVGGGDAAIEEAMQLAAYASSVTILVRKDRMRAAQRMQDKLGEYPHVKVVYNKSVIEVVGDGTVMTGLKIQDAETQAIETVAADGLFLAIGHNPSTALFEGHIKLDTLGYILLDNRTQETSCKGVFAAGDVADSKYRQAFIAASDGAKAAFDAIELLRYSGLTQVVCKRLAPHYFAGPDQKRAAL